jgi:type II secretory pathway component PulL
MGKVLFIDIKEGDVSTYLFEVSGGGYVLKEKKEYPLSDKHNFSIDAIPEDVEDTYLSLPLGSLNFRLIDLPFSDKDRIREILPFELDGMILGGQENVVIDSIVTGTSDNKHQVLAVYLEKTVMRKVLEKLKSFGAEPVFVTSIGLRPALKDFTPIKLLSPTTPAEEDRTALAVEEIKSPTINLRRDEFSYTRDIERNRKSLRVTTILILLIALLLTGDAVFKIVSTRAEIVSIKNDMRKQYQEIFPGEKNVMNELYQLKSHMKELKGKEDVFIGVAPLDLLLKLSQVDRQGSVINEVTVDKTNIALRGEAQSLSEVQQVQNRLKSILDEVNISDSKSSAQGRMMFTITAKEKRT